MFFLFFLLVFFWVCSMFFMHRVDFRIYIILTYQKKKKVSLGTDVCYPYMQVYIHSVIYQKNNVHPPNLPNSLNWNHQNLYQSSGFRLCWVSGGLKFSQLTSDKLDRNIGLYPSNPTCVHPYGQVLSKKLFISWLVHLKCFYLTG